jgi:anionic cell wall polymer biosynthesis LytR-Cps2A-Psr (LCP) family protein
MEQLTAISTLSYFPETKEQSITFAEKLVNEVLAGIKDPLNIDIQLKILSDMFTSIREQIKPNVLKEAEKYGEKTFELNGAKITIAGKTTYDYKSCNYSKYNKVIEQKEALEKFLKALTDKLYDEETGEEILPPAKKYSPYLKIEL